MGRRVEHPGAGGRLTANVDDGTEQQPTADARTEPLPTPDAPGEELPPLPTTPSRLERWAADAKAYFLGQDPRFMVAFLPLTLVSMLLFTRSPATNYIFDEQEALLGNPYVNRMSGLRFIDAIHRDFWGLPHDRSIGSYRPLPNLLWRALWHVSKQPFFHHVYNVAFHAANAALVVCIAFFLTRRRGLAWLTGLAFVTSAVLTEAVSGIVGIADVLGGLGALLALAALALPAWAMPFGVFVAMLIGLFSKESALVCVPLVPFAAIVAAPLTHPERPARLARAVGALVATAGAFVLYVELRKRWFPSPLAADLTTELPVDASQAKRAMRAALVWFHQAPMPRDPMNNPLIQADVPHRIAGALRVYWRGLAQVVFPRALSGDYSFPQEPIPDRLVFSESVLGAAMLALPPIASLGCWIGALFAERSARREAARSCDTEGAGAPSRTPSRPIVIALGAALIALATAMARLGWVELGRRGVTSLGYRVGLATVVAVVFVVGLGAIVDGLSRLPRPDAAGEPVPLGRAGLVLVSVALMWIVVSYFPHSNIPVVLPTVRAERFWYFPVIGTSAVIGVLFAAALGAARGKRLAPVAAGLVLAFFVFQGIQAYRHSMDYRSDLDFWFATKKAVPNSAKAHLNYSVMKGARGDLATRLAENLIAIDLAPNWPMGQIYVGDTLCRLKRADEAWPYYKKGFDLGPNELSLIALGLQCLWDEGKLREHEDELRALAEAHPGSWIGYLATDTLDNGEQNKGVDPKHRPRGYNEGPKD